MRAAILPSKNRKTSKTTTGRAKLPLSRGARNVRQPSTETKKLRALFKGGCATLRLSRSFALPFLLKP